MKLKKFLPLLYFLLVIVTILVTSIAYDHIYVAEKSKRGIDFLIDSFAPIKNASFATVSDTTTSTDSDSGITATGSDTDTSLPTPISYPDADTLGIMIIDRLDVKAPIGYGLSESTLLRQIGTYKTIENFGKTGKNTGFAAHSASFEGCDYCYFNTIDQLEVGDIIKIEWIDGNVYTYQVFRKYLKAAPDALFAYEIYEDRSLITLVTCSDGIADFRDFIQAELIKIESWID